jgi:hypothetical protein
MGLGLMGVKDYGKSKHWPISYSLCDLYLLTDFA